MGNKPVYLFAIIVILIMTSSCISSEQHSPSSQPTPVITFSPESEIKFENMIYSGNLGGSYKGENARLLVVFSIQTSYPDEFNWLKKEHVPIISAVDYSRYFSVLVFNGYRSGIYGDFEILHIWQDNGVISILAHFNDYIPGATSMQAYNSQYQAVKISRTSITQSGPITFKLLDESGKERSTTIADNITLK
jgi:hypothetical protein